MIYSLYLLLFLLNVHIIAFILNINLIPHGKAVYVAMVKLLKLIAYFNCLYLLEQKCEEYINTVLNVQNCWQFSFIWL